MRQESIAAVCRTAASLVQGGMFAFILPRWQPPQLPLQTLLRSSYGSSGTSATMSSLLHVDTAAAVAATSPLLAPSDAHRGGGSQRRRGRRRPRVRALEADFMDSVSDVPGALDAARSQESEGANAWDDKFDLVLTLKGMGRRFEWRGALKRFRRAKEEGMVADNNVYSCIISVMAKSGRWSEAVDLLAEAEEEGLSPNEFCFTAAVSACAKGRNWTLALSLLERMRDAGLSPDHVTYGSAVSAMAKAGQWQRALALLDQMSEEGLRPNVVCYGAAVDACAKGGEWQRAVALLEEMREAGVEPDRICYNTAVNACAQSGQWVAALSLARSMREEGKAAQPDAFTFNSVMYGMASAGEWERLLDLLEGMQVDGVAPDVVSYNTAMGACNKASQHQRALSTFEDMQTAGVKPDKETFSAAAEACAADTSGALGNRAIDLLKMAREQGLKKPGARAVAASLAAIVGGGPWRRAIPAIEGMLEASGRHAWDDVMKFLVDVQVAGEDMGAGVQVLPKRLSSAPREEKDGAKKIEVMAVTATRGGGGGSSDRPVVNGYGSDRPVGASRGGGAVAGTGAVAASDASSPARKCAPLETRRVSETDSSGRGNVSPPKDGDSRRRERCGKTARGAVAGAATLKLGCVPALAQVVVVAAACVDKASQSGGDTLF